VHLIITATDDATTHLLCERLGDRVLRVNWETWEQYTIHIDPQGFRLSDPYGRTVTDPTLGNILWRKPVASIPRAEGERWYGFQEFRAGINAILAEVRRRTPEKLLIDPERLARTDRFHQLRVAALYLPTPDWTYTSTPSAGDWNGRCWVVKSMTSQPIPDSGPPDRVMFTTAVDPRHLADGWPWLVQELIDAPYDLTVVYVDGTCFGFLLDRAGLPGLDWRQAIGTDLADHGWQPVALPGGVSGAIGKIMTDLGLRFGRLDLLAHDADCRHVVFLEVNPNGQWAWLDLDGQRGVMDAVVQFITGDEYAPSTEASTVFAADKA
jgi:hypothetical protein